MPNYLSKTSDAMVCQVCGKEFIPYRSSQKYCSKECQQKARNAKRSPKYMRNCLFCGKEFVTGRSDQVYCCKGCKKKVSYRNNREHAQATIRRHYENNKERYAELGKKYREENKDKIRERDRKYRENNREELLAKKRAYHYRMKDDPEYQEKRRISYIATTSRPEYKEWVKRYDREYRQTPEGRERARIACIRRRTLQKKAIATLTLEEWEKCLKYFDHKDAYTGLPMDIVSQDHVIPVSKGGSYAMSNIVPCERDINCSKSAKDIFDWYTPDQPFYSEARLRKILKWTGLKPNSEVQQISMF